MAAEAQPDVQVDNERCRVTRWRFAPGAATGWHRHEYDYVIVPVVTGRLKLIGPDGAESFAELEAGVSYFREAGIEHDVINDSGHDFAFVEVEFKGGKRAQASGF
ncbi:MAG: cupin domain-containing protein [Rhodovibrionaceae bacterium]